MLHAAVSQQPFSGDTIIHQARAGESIAYLGARFGIESRTLAADNGMSPATALKAGQSLVIDNRHVIPEHLTDGILINVPQRMLFVFVGERMVGAYPIAVGRPDWRTPVGFFVVSSKETHPTWDVPKSIQEEMSAAGRVARARVPPGPGNPLGDRWIGVSNVGFGIHGTNQPTSIYGFTTHGCIRLHPDDARSLFDVIWTGMPIRIVYRPVLLTIVDPDHVMVEVHTDAYGVRVRRNSSSPNDCASCRRTLSTSRRSSRRSGARPDAASSSNIASDSLIPHPRGDRSALRHCSAAAPQHRGTAVLQHRGTAALH